MLMKTFELAFIGSGNMAEALVKGIVKSGAAAPDRITVTDTRPERLDFFRTAYAVKADASNRAAASRADVILLAVKPQVMTEVLAELKGSLKPTALVISIAAGTTTATIEKALGGARVVRVMPNMPALVGSGASAVCPGSTSTKDDVATTCKLMEAVGLVVQVNESDMDAVTALSGSGPAYAFFLLECMLEAAKRMGLDADAARKLACATIAGSAKVAAESTDSPIALRERVTSKGGTTAAAMDVMHQRGVYDAFVEALLAAQRRSQELSKS
jgi:pyrroline-5-carboxylate reductase